MDDLAQYLIARVLPDAYTPRPGRPAPRYSLNQASQVLSFLARRMNQDHTRDLAWWQIPRWAPARPRILASMLAGGLLGAVLGGLTAVFGGVLRAVLGAMLGLTFTQDFWAMLGSSVVSLLAVGFGVGLSLGPWLGRGGYEPNRVKTWRAISLRSVLTAGLAVGLAVGLGLVFVFVLVFVLVEVLSPMATGWFTGSAGAFTRGLLVGLVTGFLLGFKRNLRGGFSDVERAVGFADDEGRPQGPRESWRSDRVFAIVVGLAFGLAFGLMMGILVGLPAGLGWLDESGGGRVVGSGLRAGLVTGLVAWLVSGLTVGLTYGVMSSVTWSTTLAWRLQLQRSHQVPAVGLMSFLDDARDRGVLRTVGAVYQFRHATLQDQLAGQITSSPSAASEPQVPS